MVWIKPPKIASAIFRDVIWNIPNNENKIFLTFDDGPTPEVTPWVLSVLQSYQIKANFFCLGKNVKLFPEIFHAIKNNGHVIGNHSECHLKGWKTKNETYFQNIADANKVLNSNFFRPPYGKIKPSQIKYLKEKYKIIMWDVLSRDYDKNISPEQCIHNVLDNVQSGSIIVFHDSKKAEKNLKGSLESIITNLTTKYQFDVIK